MTDNYKPARSSAGLKILEYASKRDHTVVEFSMAEDCMMVQDITEHVDKLEEMTDASE